MLSSFYRYDAFYHLVTAFYPYESDSDMQNRFDQSKISNSNDQYIEELELQIF